MRAARGADVGVQRVRDERVHELQRPADRAGVDQQATSCRGIERLDHDRFGEADHVEEHVFVEVDAEHRRGGEHLCRVFTERVDAAPDDVAQAGRHGAGSRSKPVSVQCRISCGRIQRVAGGLCTQRVDELLGFGRVGGAAVRRHQVVQLVRVETNQAQAGGSRPARGRRGRAARRRTHARPDPDCSGPGARARRRAHAPGGAAAGVPSARPTGGRRASPPTAVPRRSGAAHQMPPRT